MNPLFIIIILILIIVGVAMTARAGSGSGFQNKMGIDEAVQVIATSMARFETGFRGSGFPLDPSQWKGRAKTNKNPGNLRFIGQTNTLGQDSAGYAIFDSAQHGWEAMLKDIKAKLTGRTRTGLGPHSNLFDLIHVYAPEVENPTAAYIQFVSAETGIDPSWKFQDFILY